LLIAASWFVVAIVVITVGGRLFVMLFVVVVLFVTVSRFVVPLPRRFAVCAPCLLLPL
jgi:hypothetical protein